jgi:hypothetical protein
VSGRPLRERHLTRTWRHPPARLRGSPPHCFQKNGPPTTDAAVPQADRPERIHGDEDLWGLTPYLAFFSRNERGLQFWNEVLKYSDDQLSLI